MSENKLTTPLRTSIANASTPQEIGEFWDTHSLHDFWDSTREVEFEVRARPRKRVVVEERIFREIQQEAKVRGVAPEKLVNLWLAEKLQPSKIS